MRKLVLFIGLFLSAGILFADEDVSVKANAPNVVKKGQQFRLVYTINAKVDGFDAPSIDDFRVLAGPSTSTSTNISIVNNQMTRKFELKYTYVLEADKEGTFTIAPAKVKVEGKVYESNALKIEVIKGGSSSGKQQQGNAQKNTGSGTAQPGDKLFVRVLIDDRDVYRDEPIVATIKIYSKLRISDLRNVRMPDFQGFYKQEIPTPDLRHLEKENVNGEIYQTGVLKRYLLFPQKTGKITIEPFETDFIVQKRVQSNSRSIFDDFFGSYKNVKMPVSSDPVTINVRTLPSGEPVDFTGGVGSFDIEASLDKQSVKNNEGVNLTVKISGKGNLKILDAPQVDFPPDLETYDPKVSKNMDVSVNGATGSVEYEYLMIPRSAGNYRIPSISYTYFDLPSKSYKTLTTKPLSISVERGEGDTTAGGRSTSFTQKDVNMIGSDIRYIKTEDFDMKEKGKFIFGSFWFYFAYIFGILLFVLLYLFRKKRIKENADTVLAKNKKANKYAKRRLKEASKHLTAGDNDQFYEETLKALWGYLSDKLGISVAELSREKAKQRLNEKQVDEALIDHFLELIDECEFARYAPSSEEGRMDKLYKQAITNISQLQQKLK